MNKSILHDIDLHVKRLKEQAAPPPAPPPAPPDPNTPAPDAAAGAPPDPNAPPAEAGGDDAEGGEGAGEENAVPEGQPPVDPKDPVGAVVNHVKELVGKTIDYNTILKSAKRGIQSNFNNIKDAWPVVGQLKDTENRNLVNIAKHLELFIGNQITENKYKGSETMKVSKQEIRELVREAVKSQTTKPTKKEVKLTKEQFEKIVRNAVVRKLNEGALFDTYRSQIDQEQSAIEQQLTSADIRRMAIDLFEKICDKTGVDVDSDNPESPAMKFVTAELDRMVTSAQEVANKLIQVATVVKTAAGGTPKKEEGQG